MMLVCGIGMLLIVMGKGQIGYIQHITNKSGGFLMLVRSVKLRPTSLCVVLNCRNQEWFDLPHIPSVDSCRGRTCTPITKPT